MYGSPSARIQETSSVIGHEEVLADMALCVCVCVCVYHRFYWERRICLPGLQCVGLYIIGSMGWVYLSVIVGSMGWVYLSVIVSLGQVYLSISGSVGQVCLTAKN